MQKVPGLLVFALAGTAVLTSADHLRKGFEGGYEQIQEKDLQADLGFLASDQLEGRLSLTRGSEVAVQWIASEIC